MRRNNYDQQQDAADIIARLKIQNQRLKYNLSQKQKSQYSNSNKSNKSNEFQFDFDEKSKHSKQSKQSYKNPEQEYKKFMMKNSSEFDKNSNPRSKNDNNNNSKVYYDAEQKHHNFDNQLKKSKYSVSSEQYKKFINWQKSQQNQQYDNSSKRIYQQDNRSKKSYHTNNSDNISKQSSKYEDEQRKRYEKWKRQQENQDTRRFNQWKKQQQRKKKNNNKNNQYQKSQNGWGKSQNGWADSPKWCQNQNSSSNNNYWKKNKQYNQPREQLINSQNQKLMQQRRRLKQQKSLLQKARNNIQNNIQKINKGMNYDYYFLSNEYAEQIGIVIDGGRTITNNNDNYNNFKRFRINLIEGVAKKGSKVKFRINKISNNCTISLGLAIADIIIPNKYSFDFAEGVFLVSNWGITCCYSDPKYNINNIQDGKFKFNENDQISVQILQNQVLFKNLKKKKEYKIPLRISSQEYQSLKFCIELGLKTSVSLI